MTSVRSESCSSCPYRRDVPSGVWSAAEYDKLEAYDLPTAEQPPNAFGCHATPDHYCHGWAVVGSNRGHGHELMALRIAALVGDYDDELPDADPRLFNSGHDAAEHGRRDILHPSQAAIDLAARLARKYDHLDYEDRYRRYDACPHCGSTLRPGASTCPVCGPHAHARP